MAYRKAGYSKKFWEEHEEEILLHQAAKNAFDEMGVKKLPKVKELHTEYAKWLEEKKNTYAEYRRSREEMRELLTAKANVDVYKRQEQHRSIPILPPMRENMGSWSSTGLPTMQISNARIWRTSCWRICAPSTDRKSVV